MESIFIQINQSFPISSPPIIPRTFNLMKLLSFQNMPFTVLWTEILSGKKVSLKFESRFLIATFLICYKY